MSKYTFKVETENLDELDVYHKAHTNSYIVFELKNNFHRRFESLEGHHEEFYKGVEYVLEELKHFINSYNND